MRIAKIVLAVAVVIYLSAVVAMYFMQRELLYSPDVTRVMPSDVSISGIEEVTLTTPAGENLYSWQAHG